MAFRDLPSSTATLINAHDLSGAASFDTNTLPSAGFGSYVIGVGPGSDAGGCEWMNIRVIHAITTKAGTPNLATVVAVEAYELKTGDGVAGSGTPATLTGRVKGGQIDIIVGVDAGTLSGASIEAALHTIAVPYDGRMRPNQNIAHLPNPPVLDAGSADLELYAINDSALAHDGIISGYCLPYSGPITIGSQINAPGSTVLLDFNPGHPGMPVVTGGPTLALPAGRASLGPFYLPRKQCEVFCENTDVNPAAVGISVIGADFS